MAVIPLKKKSLQIILFKIQFLPHTKRMNLHYTKQTIKALLFALRIIYDINMWYSQSVDVLNVKVTGTSH